jgi:hypothetical protein
MKNYTYIHNYLEKRIAAVLNIVTCRGLRVTYKRVLHWMTAFIDTLYTPLGTTGNYTAIADLHTLQFTVTH